MTKEDEIKEEEIREKIKIIQKKILSLQYDMKEEQRNIGMLFVKHSEAEKIEKGEYVLAHFGENISFNKGPERFSVVDSNNRYKKIRDFLA